MESNYQSGEVEVLVVVGNLLVRFEGSLQAVNGEVAERQMIFGGGERAVASASRVSTCSNSITVCSRRCRPSMVG